MGKTRIKKHMSVTFQPSFYEKLKIYCKKKGYPKSNLIEIIINKWFNVITYFEEISRQFNIQIRLEVVLTPKNKKYDGATIDYEGRKHLLKLIDDTVLNLDRSFAEYEISIDDKPINYESAEDLANRLEEIKKLVNRKYGDVRNFDAVGKKRKDDI